MSDKKKEQSSHIFQTATAVLKAKRAMRAAMRKKICQTKTKRKQQKQKQIQNPK